MSASSADGSTQSSQEPAAPQENKGEARLADDEPPGEYQSQNFGSDEQTSDELRRADMISREARLGHWGPARCSPSLLAGKEKSLGVGARHLGSATRAREQPISTSKIMDVLRKAARRASSESTPDKNDDIAPADTSSNRNSAKMLSSKIDQDMYDSPRTIIPTTSQIHSAIGDLLSSNFPRNTQAQSGPFQAAVTSLKKSVGILGDRVHENHPLMSAPLVRPPTSGIYARVATSMDDLDIASLRLSVFSDFSFDQRGQFCAHFCQAIANRRKRGAVCIVATKGDDYSPRIYGTAECSFHEFYGTQLGQRRPWGSILYVTEVAVHPAARRQGIGSMLLEAIDSYAERRRIETVYLHVDVCNEEALGLYKKCGYRKVDSSEPVFEEFTKSLNLHPGATKGRSHHLLFKDIGQATWLPHDMFVSEPHRTVGNLGFEIPA